MDLIGRAWIADSRYKNVAGMQVRLFLHHGDLYVLYIMLMVSFWSGVEQSELTRSVRQCPNANIRLSNQTREKLLIHAGLHLDCCVEG